MEESVFMDRVRNLVSVLDRGVYGLISAFYDIIEKLANTTIINSSSIDEISGKIYALIAVFMIFKISFSLINYIVNPDMIVDKVKGGGTLVRNILITFILIIFVPFGFDFLYRAQSAILSDAIIEKLIYGSTYSEKTIDIIMDEDYCGDKKASTSNIGDFVGLMAFKTFFQIDDDSDPDDFIEEFEDKYCTASVGTGSASVGNLLKSDVYNAPHGWSFEHNYVVNYTIFISTIVGAVLVLVFLSFCFDIAMRSIKLIFLEILAPVPIISYIDPDKSKNGMFSKWLKEVASTWLSLFMRLLAFHIAIYFISFLGENASFGDNIWISLLIIIGILMFAKQLPKLLENIMGIKASGNFNLNPLKKLDEEALGFKQARKLAAGAVSGTAAVGMSAVGTINRYKERKNQLATEDSKLEEQYSNELAKKQLEADKKLRQQMLNYQKLDRMGIPGMKDKIREYRANYDETMRNMKKQNAEDLANEKSKLRGFSDNHPLAGGLLAAVRAGNEAFRVDHKSIQAIIENASKAATNAAKERTYRDNYGIGDRAMNQITDWGDVKKSGTADVVDRRVKELNDQLTQVTNALDSLRQEQSSFAPGTFMWETSGPNAGMISVSPTANPNDIIRARENVRMQQELQQTMKDLNSAIKSQTKILEQSKK